jgi:hypothetical protein
MNYYIETPPPGQPLPGWHLIMRERVRQIAEEGWTPEHDAEHDSCELTRAAITYAWAAEHIACGGIPVATGLRPVPSWPWDPSWWKPSDDPIRNLVKAGALIAAEIDRLQRAEDNT